MLLDLFLILSALVIGLLAFLAVSRARALDRRIQEQLAEEEDGPKDPYDRLAQIACVQEEIAKQKRRSWPKA